MIGQVIGDYKILKQLGEGGMGMVYLGEHVQLKQKVAIKALHPTLFNNDNARDRFVREAEVLARLNHPNIIRLLNFYNLPQGCFIVMEYAEGETLEDKLQKAGLVPPTVAVPCFIQVLHALEYAHKLGVIHRDLKPSNIMLATGGIAKLLDFGTAKLSGAHALTQQGMTLGTIIYMSKEQLLGKPLDARSDVYSLGVTLYETTTGQLPFYDDEEKKLVLKIAKQEPIPPSQHYPPMAKELERIILKALSKEPEHRFQTSDEMAEALEAFARAGGILAPPTTAGPALPARPAPAAPQGATPSPPKDKAKAAGAAGSPILHPLFLVGIFLLVASIGFGAGLPLANVVRGVVGIGIGVGGAVVALGLMALAFLSAGSTGSKRLCPKCGRALLPDIKDCPFCKPPAPAGGPAQPQWAGETVNQGFQPGPPPAMPSGAGQPAPGSGVLFIVDGAEKGKQFPLGPAAPVTIGRAPGNTIILSDPGVSSNHCSIVHDGQRYIVQDLGARNGVFVNNSKITRQPLNGGDLVVIGTTRILVNMR
jgi:tRNA A-37 threonylcarbamoyl transferase component Bud32